MKKQLILASGFLIVLFLLVFRSFLSENAVLMTTDAAIVGADKTVLQVGREMMSNWDSCVLLGMPRSPFTQTSSLLKACFSGVVWNNLVYGLACLAASLVFLVGFGRKLNRWAVLCGALTAFWLGSNFSLLYAGHVQKPFVILFFICSLLSSGVPSWRGGVLWGGFTGLMFVQQPDVAMFFAMFSGAHWVFTLWRREGLKPMRWLPVIIPAVVVVLLFAAGTLLSGYTLNVKDTAQVQTESPEEKWDYMTQWSIPPDETISMIAPGYNGWRSGEPTGPYWGRVGRSAGWEQTQQGFMNFMMESTYVGIIPAIFALFGLFSCRRSPHRAEIIFWGAATLVSLLLAFGKYFPLYSLFYQLPIVNNIRNPNKFIQIAQVALAILTVYGFDALFERRGKEPEDGDRKQTKSFFWLLSAGLGILVLSALSVSMNYTNGVAGFMTKGWPEEAAKSIVSNQSRALWHATFMAASMAAVFAVFSFPAWAKAIRFKTVIAAAVVLLVVGDALILARHYVQPMPRSYIQANALTEYLKSHLGTGRVALLTQQDIYNVWISYLLPYHQIDSFNFSQMPRMPEDYQNFLTAGSKDPLRMWRFSSVKYLLGPAMFEKQFPAGQVKKVFSYNLLGMANNEFQLVADPKGAHAVFEMLQEVPRHTLLSGFQSVSDAQVLARLSGSGALLNGTTTGTVEIIQSRSGYVQLKAQADEAVMLRCAERWDRDWKATVDGQPVDIQRIDFLCQGISLPAGTHEVTLRYAPARLFFYLQCAGYLILLVALFWRRSPVVQRD